MHDFSAARIKKMVIHYVGNKGKDESLVLGHHHLNSLSVEDEEMLSKFFLKPFQTEEYHQFSHHTDLKMNESFNYVSDLFLTPINFIEASQNLATHLYENSMHPRVSGGELYAIVFDDVVYNGESVEALGLFKTERKDYYLNVSRADEKFKLSIDKGIDIRKLDKGCVVFNADAENGFMVLTHDQLSKGDEAQYWKEDFLGLKSISNEFSMTKNYMSMCKSFVMDQLPQEFEVDRTTQIEMMNRSSGYFTENEQIDVQEYADSILDQPEVKESFHAYREQFQQENAIEIEDQFQSSKQAVRQGKKFFKSVLKLDKNFHLYVHGNKELIEQGFDEERGMKYYKVFYNEEQ